MKLRHGFALVIFTAVSMWAQTAAPNSAGIAINHIHLYVPDIGAQMSFWTLLGGTPVLAKEGRGWVQFPGIEISLTKNTPTGGSAGSVVNHVGFQVKSISEWMPKWKAAGLQIDAESAAKINPKSVFLLAPDGVRVEIVENPTLSSPIAMHHIHMFLMDPMAAQAWYVKNFGAVAGKRGRFLTANVPGTEIAFTPTDVAQVPTKSRSLEHIGFEVQKIDEFVKTLAAAGIQTEAPVNPTSSDPKRRSTHITDPWGTRIELTGR